LRDERFERALDTYRAYRVLASGDDVVTGGRKLKSSTRLHPISYWIFAGRSVDRGLSSTTH
jgi:hypothetical protein